MSNFYISNYYSYFMKRISFGLTCFLFTIINTYSQQNYLPGYVIKQNGDTLRGYINYLNWEKNPLNVYFKADLDKNADIFSPAEIKLFSVGNEIYRTGTVDINTGLYNTKDLGYSTDISLTKGTVLLQMLIGGPKSLYYLKDNEGRGQFYIEYDSHFELLIYHKYLRNIKKNVGYTTSITEDKRYIGQLTFYLKDCASLQSQLRNLIYDKQSMIKLFRQYYECTDVASDFEKKSDETRSEFGVFAGMSLTYLSFSDYEDQYDELANSDFPGSTNFTLGISLNRKLSRNLGRFSIHNEIMFSAYETNATYKEIENENKYETSNITIGGKYIKLNNMLQYELPVNDFTLMMRLGVSNGLNINETNEKEVETVFYSTTDSRTVPAIESTRKYAIGFLAGVGASYKQCSLDIRFEKISGLSDITTLGSSIGALYFLLGYKF